MAHHHLVDRNARNATRRGAVLYEPFSKTAGFFLIPLFLSPTWLADGLIPNLDLLTENKPTDTNRPTLH